MTSRAGNAISYILVNIVVQEFIVAQQVVVIIQVEFRDERLRGMRHIRHLYTTTEICRQGPLLGNRLRIYFRLATLANALLALHPLHL